MEKDLFDQRDMTILIVDDEPRIRDVVRMNLELEHYRVIEASNGLEALEQLRENLPDLIVLDVMMPEMDGFETLRAIREVSTVPVIMLTVRQSEQDKILAERPYSHFYTPDKQTLDMARQDNSLSLDIASGELVYLCYRYRQVDQYIGEHQLGDKVTGRLVEVKNGRRLRCSQKNVWHAVAASTTTCA